MTLSRDLSDVDRVGLKTRLEMRLVLT